MLDCLIHSRLLLAWPCPIFQGYATANDTILDPASRTLISGAKIRCGACCFAPSRQAGKPHDTIQISTALVVVPAATNHWGFNQSIERRSAKHDL